MQSKTRLDRWIKDKGLTYGEVSALTGMSRSMVSRAARGERQFSAIAKVTVARRLGVRVTALFDTDEQPMKDCA
jgi:transcriptional regulator with XRE-family HTH domain